MLTFKDLSDKNLARVEKSFHPLDSWSLTDWATAVAGECGEMCNLIKKTRRGENIPKEDIGREIADLVIYADLLAARLGLSMAKCVEKKFNEVSDRVGSDIKIN